MTIFCVIKNVFQSSVHYSITYIRSRYIHRSSKYVEIQLGYVTKPASLAESSRRCHGGRLQTHTHAVMCGVALRDLILNVTLLVSVALARCICILCSISESRYIETHRVAEIHYKPGPHEIQIHPEQRPDPLQISPCCLLINNPVANQFISENKLHCCLKIACVTGIILQGLDSLVIIIYLFPLTKPGW